MEIFAHIGSREPTVFFAWIITIVLSQLLIWGMARHTADVEWWKASVIGTVSLVLFDFIGYSVALEGVAGFALSYVITAIVLWEMSGFVYEMERWQKVVTALVCPLSAGLTLYCGILLRDGIFQLS